MRRAGGLFAQVIGFTQLIEATERAWRGRKNQRGLEALRFMVDRERRVLALQRALHEETWRPGALRAFVIRDPKLRLICAAPFEDRVVHHALCAAISPRLDAALSRQSHACRVGYGTHSALKSAQRLARAYPFALRLDVAHYFESIPHDPLCARFVRLFKEPPLLALIERIIRHPTPFGPRDRGLPIGSLTSQHAANLYLSELDHALPRRFRLGYVRYMDDLVIGVSSAAEAWRVHDFVQAHLAERGLTLKPSATQLASTSAGFQFLGFRLWPHRVRLDAARRRRLVRRVIQLKRDAARGHDEDALRARSEGVNAWASLGDTRGLRASLWSRHGLDFDLDP